LLSFNRRDRGCPIPPAAPRTVTLEFYKRGRFVSILPNRWGIAGTSEKLNR
jgi:hypothetical protein